MRALAAAWITTISIVLLTALFLQLTYDPPRRQVAGPQPSQDTPTVVVEIPNAVSDRQANGTTPDLAGGKALDESGVAGDTTEGPDTESAARGISAGEAALSESGLASNTGNTPSLGIAGLAAADPFLQEEGPYGPLPLTRNGRQPWRIYGRPDTSPPDRPRIAIVLTGLGQNSRVTRRTIEDLPGEISLALSPYGQDLPAWSDAARAAGHEVLLMLPMEPLEYPIHDPGPHTLLATDPPELNIDKLHFLLARFQGYVGVVNEMGSKFTASREALLPVMEDLLPRGLLFLDSRSTRFSLAAQVATEINLPQVSNSRFIDDQLRPDYIDRQLAALEERARARGFAVGLGHSYPLTIDRVQDWLRSLNDKGIDLVPITALAATVSLN